jgi:hypothetical protein
MLFLIFMNFFAVHRFLLFLYLHYAFRCHLASILKHNFFFWKFWICLVYLIVLQSWLFLIKVKGLINIFSHIEIHKSFLSLLDALLNKFLNEVNLYFYFFLKINYYFKTFAPFPCRLCFLYWWLFRWILLYVY